MITFTFRSWEAIGNLFNQSDLSFLIYKMKSVISLEMCCEDFQRDLEVIGGGGEGGLILKFAREAAIAHFATVTN